MGCGFEHFSNCHGEITGLLFMLSVGGLWFRTQYYVIKNWILIQLSHFMKKG